ncbi:MAG: hypothetical protein QOK05_249 [Chloroflexota bacterium]|jgi:hypothetical protein|nr:hypothetical protein [Chloroflexota bacterium]
MATLRTFLSRVTVLAVAAAVATLAPAATRLLTTESGYGEFGWPVAHSLGKLCQVGAKFDDGGFGTAPVAHPVVAGGLAKLPRFPGAYYGAGGPSFAVQAQPGFGVINGGTTGAGDESRTMQGNGLYCGAAGASQSLTTGAEIDTMTRWLDSAMSGAGWTKVGELTGDSRGHGTRMYRRGRREWSSIAFEYSSRGMVDRLPDGLFHGTISYSIAPYPCNGDHSCGPWVFAGSLGT